MFSTLQIKFQHWLLFDKFYSQGIQGLIQDLNLCGSRNLVSFTMATNVVIDSRHAVIRDMAREANTWNGFKRSRNLYFDTFFHVDHQLLLTKNYLKLTCVWARKALPCCISVMKHFAEHGKTNECVFSICRTKKNYDLKSSHQSTVKGLQTLLKKKLWRRCFPVSYTKFLRTHFGGCFCDLHIHVYTVNLCKTTTLGTTQKWSSWAGGRLVKHLYKTTTDEMWSFLAGF